jgi:hypothetical protein
MGLADAIGKLITEHGSAEILRAHLALIRDQAAVIDRENASLSTRLRDAEKKNESLTMELALLKRTEEKPTMKWGCVVFEGDENLYCPACFYDRGRKIPTSRKGPGHRFCAVCKTDIPSR